ncbi:signal peptidase II [Candidatus Woesearchaeota archaeon B3_Woes]|nr:MAG: signal peptidase II [Candidatus Woesearchaeota archaeon B3_Woes]
MVKKNIFLLSAFIIVVVDQLTKYLVKVLNISYITNSGSLFGLFKGASSILAWLSIVIIGLFLFNYDKIQKGDWKLKLGSGLVVGGAIGNLIDRILYQGVIDFINLRIWPSFNIADSALSVGIILLIIYFIKE